MILHVLDIVGVIAIAVMFLVIGVLVWWDHDQRRREKAGRRRYPLPNPDDAIAIVRLERQFQEDS